MRRRIIHILLIYSFFGIAAWCIAQYIPMSLLESDTATNQYVLATTSTLFVFPVDTTTSSAYIVEKQKVYPRLRIDKIGVDMPIITDSSDEQYALARGAWLIPGSENPWEPSGYMNTVISGHRYQYTSGPNTFFNLDMLSEGDRIVLDNAGIEKVYRVISSFVVQPDAVHVLEKTDLPVLTLITCHPVFTTKERLIVRAVLESL